jgi:hypothetical protein
MLELYGAKDPLLNPYSKNKNMLLGFLDMNVSQPALPENV